VWRPGWGTPSETRREPIHSTKCLHFRLLVLYSTTTLVKHRLVMRKKMINLTPNHRLHIPNGLAVFAALLLLVSSVVGFESNQDVYSSGQSAAPSSKVESADNDRVNDAAQHTRRGLKLGLLLLGHR